MLPLIFDKRLFVYLFVGFVVASVAGTLSHECGHWAASRYFGFRHQHIGYAYTIYGTPGDAWQTRDSVLQQYVNEAKEKRQEAPAAYNKLMWEAERDSFLITAGGPLQTMLTGTLGILLLLVRRKKFTGKEHLSFDQWFCVFLSLFWLREIFNVVIAMVQTLRGRLSMHGDEFRMAVSLHWHPWSIYIVVGAISLLVLWVVVFKFIPIKERVTFLSAGMSGGLAGAYLWLVLLGPRLMP